VSPESWTNSLILSKTGRATAILGQGVVGRSWPHFWRWSKTGTSSFQEWEALGLDAIKP